MSRLSRSATILAAAAALLGAAPSFEAASVRPHTGERPRVRVTAAPGRLTITAMTVREVIQAAYGLQPFELVAADNPALNQSIDIVAKAPAAATIAEMQQMLQPLLAERFGLTVHREPHPMDVYLLVVARADRRGPGLRASTTTCTGVGTTNVFALAAASPAPNGEAGGCGILPGGIGRIVAKGLPMSGLAALLAPSQRRPVLDRTGLPGAYDIDLTYTPEPFTAAALAARGAAAPPGVDPGGPSIFTALQEQLGLRLDAARADVEVLVVDRLTPLVPD